MPVLQTQICNSRGILYKMLRFMPQGIVHRFHDR